MSRKTDQDWRPNFNAHAVALSGRITKLGDAIVDQPLDVPNGSAALGPNGGRSFSRSGGGDTTVYAGARSHTVVSFAAAEAEAVGTYREDEKFLTVRSRTLLKGLTIRTDKPRFFLPLAESGMSSLGKPVASERRLDVWGRFAEPIQFGESRVMVKLRSYTNKTIEELLKFGDAFPLLYRKSGAAPHQRSGAVATSLVTGIEVENKGELDGAEPLKTADGRLYALNIPDFGTLFFGELTIQPTMESDGVLAACVQFNLMRMELGCPADGSLSGGGNVQTEPQGHPPRFR
jgi:hypothetical protein